MAASSDFIALILPSPGIGDALSPYSLVACKEIYAECIKQLAFWILAEKPWFIENPYQGG